jgi:hypothetical protein
MRVLANRVLKRIFGLKKDDVLRGGGGGTLHNEELCNLYFSPSINRMIKSRRMRWAGYIVQMGRRRMRVGYRLESQRNRDH